MVANSDHNSAQDFSQTQVPRDLPFDERVDIFCGWMACWNAGTLDEDQEVDLFDALAEHTDVADYLQSQAGMDALQIRTDLLRSTLSEPATGVAANDCLTVDAEATSDLADFVDGLVYGVDDLASLGWAFLDNAPIDASAFLARFDRADADEITLLSKLYTQHAIVREGMRAVLDVSERPELTKAALLAFDAEVGARRTVSTDSHVQGAQKMPGRLAGQRHPFQRLLGWLAPVGLMGATAAAVFAISGPLFDTEQVKPPSHAAVIAEHVGDDVKAEEPEEPETILAMQEVGDVEIEEIDSDSESMRIYDSQAHQITIIWIPEPEEVNS